MSNHAYTEAQLVEQPAIGLFAALGWQTALAKDEVLGKGGTLGRETPGEVVLEARLRAALGRLNPTVPRGTVFMYDNWGLKDGYGNPFATQAWVGSQGFVTNLASHNVSELTNDDGYLTGAYSPANPGYWAGSPPATLAEMGDRLAAMLSNNGATPVP